MKAKFLGALSLTISLLLTGCSTHGEPKSTTLTPTPKATKTAAPEFAVTKAEFKAAKALLRKSCDEFDGTCSYDWPGDIGRQQSNAGGRSGSVELSVFLAKPSIHPLLLLNATYMGDSWIFFDSLQTRAAGRTTTFQFGTSDLTHDVFDSGTVYEAGSMFISRNQALKLLAFATANNSKFRLNGGKGLFTAAPTSRARELLKASIVTWLGLKQGF